MEWTKRCFGGVKSSFGVYVDFTNIQGFTWARIIIALLFEVDACDALTTTDAASSTTSSWPADYWTTTTTTPHAGTTSTHVVTDDGSEIEEEGLQNDAQLLQNILN